MNSPAPAPRKGPATGIFVALGIVIAGALGWFVQQHLPTSGESATSSASPPVAAPPPPSDATAPAAAEAPQVPEILPQFTLNDRDGKPRTLGEWKGQPLVVNYWATWCAPCVREIPLLSQLRQERKAQNLEIIGIAVDFRDDVLKFARERDLEYPLLIGEEDGLAAVSAVGMQPAFPFTLFADSQQRIVALKIGELHHDEATLILDRVADVDAGKLELEAAREQIAEGLKTIATRRGLAEAEAAAASQG